MRNCDDWKASKYVRKNGRLIASRDPKEVGISSRLITDRIAECYDANLKLHAKGRLLDLGCGKVPLYDAYKNMSRTIYASIGDLAFIRTTILISKLI
jgi:hypothetical protein